MRRSLATCIFAALAAISAGAAKADLIGSTATAALYYPNLASLFDGPQTATVSGAVEFPTLAFDGTLDVTGNKIIWTATSAETYGGGPGVFNGFRLDFAGAPIITSVTIDPSSTMVITPSSPQFTSTSVFMNLQGDTVSLGEQAILDVSFGSAVAEPGSLALLGAGLLITGLVRRKRS